MNSTLNNSFQINIPTSYIKSPGTLILNSNRCLTDREDFHVSSRKYFSEPTASLDSLDEPMILKDKTASSLDKILKGYAVFDMTSPGKLKGETEDSCKSIQKIKKAFELYNINLVIKTSTNTLKESHSLFEALTYEVSLYPIGFFAKLKLQSLIICGNENCKANLFEQNIFIIMSNFDTRATILEKFYKIIFNHIIIVKRGLIEEWKNVISNERSQNMNKPQDSWDLESTFIALLKNLNCVSVQPKIHKLREVLSKIFPEDMSQEWFERRNKIKKHMFHVSFASGSKVCSSGS